MFIIRIVLACPFVFGVYMFCILLSRWVCDPRISPLCSGKEADVCRPFQWVQGVHRVCPPSEREMLWQCMQTCKLIVFYFTRLFTCFVLFFTQFLSSFGLCCSVFSYCIPILCSSAMGPFFPIVIYLRCFLKAFWQMFLIFSHPKDHIERSSCARLLRASSHQLSMVLNTMNSFN